MSTRVTCRCGQAFAATAELAGRTVPCPFCGAAIAIPASLRPAPAATTSGPSPRLLIALCASAAAVVFLLVVALAVRAILTSDEQAPQTALAPATQAPAETSHASPPSAPPMAGAPVDPRATEPAAVSAPSGEFLIGPGIYELKAAGAEPVEGTELLSSAGLTITGGARLANNVSAAEARARLNEFRAGNTAPLGDVIVSWALIIKPEPKEPGPVKNPAARPITVNGLTGFEVQGPGVQRTWAFAFVDHSLMVSVRGPQERIRSPEVQSILGSLRRRGGIPQELLGRAKDGAVQ